MEKKLETTAKILDSRDAPGIESTQMVFLYDSIVYEINLPYRNSNLIKDGILTVDDFVAEKLRRSNPLKAYSLIRTADMR